MSLRITSKTKITFGWTSKTSWSSIQRARIRFSPEDYLAKNGTTVLSSQETTAKHHHHCWPTWEVGRGFAQSFCTTATSPPWSRESSPSVKDEGRGKVKPCRHSHHCLPWAHEPPLHTICKKSVDYVTSTEQRCCAERGPPWCLADAVNERRPQPRCRCHRRGSRPLRTAGLRITINDGATRVHVNTSCSLQRLVSFFFAHAPS